MIVGIGLCDIVGDDLHLLTRGPLDDAINWLEQQEAQQDTNQIVEVVLCIFRVGTLQNFITLSTAIEAAILKGVCISSFGAPMDVMGRLLIFPVGNHLRQLIWPNDALDKTAKIIFGCKNLLELRILNDGYRGYSEQHVQNFADAIKSLVSLHTVIFQGVQRSSEKHDTRVLGLVLDALGNLPELSTLQLDDWIPPPAKQPTNVHAKFSQLLNRIKRFQMGRHKLPDVVKVIQNSKSIQTLCVHSNVGIRRDQETYRLLGDLVCPPNKENPEYSSPLETLILRGFFPPVPRDTEMLPLFQSLEKSTKIKTIHLDLWDEPSPNIQTALQSMLANNLTLSSIIFKPVRVAHAAQPLRDLVDPFLVDRCIHRNQRCKSLVESDKTTIQEAVDFLVEHKNQLNTIFYFLSKKPSIIESCFASWKTRVAELPAENDSLKLLLAQNTSLKAQHADQKTGAIWPVYKASA